MNFRKVGSYVLLTVMSSPLFVWAGSQLILVGKNAIQISAVENEMTTVRKEIKDIHWYLIKRNGVKVPKVK